MKKIVFMGLNYPNWMIEDLCMEFEIINIQDVWNSDKDEKEKERLYRAAIEESDILFNVHTGLFFWAKASYAKLKGKKVVTYWDGDDLSKAINGYNGYLGHQKIDIHLAMSEKIREGLETIGIYSVVLPVYQTSDKDWLKEFKVLLGD